MSATNNWKELCADKKKRQAAEIPKEWLLPHLPPDSQLDVSNVPAKCGHLTQEELEYTETKDVGVILKKLASGEWSSVAVTRAYYKRAIIAQQLTNCLTEIFVERALARAAELDAHLKSTGKVVGALHGLPNSLKDQLRMKGLETTMGYVSWIGNYAERDCSLVSILYEAGAVPFVRTNVPQTLMWPETFNNIFGRTSNPYNRNLTSGGSSGGEGALIAMGGSPLGVGSDIGGSIRIPSGFCGLYSLRPCNGRIPYEGAANSMEGQDSILSVFGPLSRSLSGVKLFTKAIIDLKPWTKDPLAVRKEWDEKAYRLSEHGDGKDLVFAILWDNGHVIPHPPVRRALEMTKAALIADGHKVIDWPSFDYEALCINLGLIWGAGASEDYRTVTAASGEPVISSMSLDQFPDVPSFRPSDGGITAYQLWQLQKKKTEIRKKHLDHWNATRVKTGTGRPVDAIISPMAAYAAPPHGKNRNANYTMAWNGLDCAACIFPVTKVSNVLDQKQPPHQFLNNHDKANYELYDPEVFKNAPVALQLVGGTLEEEAVIAMTEIVDRALVNYKRVSPQL